MAIKYTYTGAISLLLIASFFLGGCVGSGSGSTATDNNTSVVVNPGDTTSTPTSGDGMATLDWIPPTQYTDGTALTDLAVYKVYYGTSPDSMINVIENVNPGLTSVFIENLQSNTTYYFAMTAVDSNGIESNFSNIVPRFISG